MESRREDVSKWTVEEVAAFIRQQFGEEVAEKFAEEEMDGETAVMLADTGSSENYKELGLARIKHQLQYKKHFGSFSMTAEKQVQQHQPAREAHDRVLEDRKLRKDEMSKLTDEEKKIYLIRRNRVQSATVEAWAGNNLPVFKGKGEIAESSKAEMETLVQRLVKGCTYSPASLPGVTFGEKAIHRHILDCLNERRRQVRKGHDYEKPNAKRMKSCSEGKNGRDNDDDEEQNDKETVHEPSTSAEEKDENYDEKTDRSASAEEMSEESDDEKQDEEETESDWEKELSLKSCEVIILVAFDVQKMKDLTRSQLMNSAKKLQPKIKRGSDKKEIIKVLAVELIKHKHVKVETHNYCNVKRAEVTKLVPL